MVKDSNSPKQEKDAGGAGGGSTSGYVAKSNTARVQKPCPNNWSTLLSDLAEYTADLATWGDQVVQWSNAVGCNPQGAPPNQICVKINNVAKEFAKVANDLTKFGCTNNGCNCASPPPVAPKPPFL